MRVRCERVVDTMGRPVERSPWLTPGREYPVLEISAATGDRVLFRIVGDDRQTPGLHEASLFTTVSPTMPSTWTAEVGDDGNLKIGPQAWKRPGFWEDFFDRKPEALAVFREEYQRMTGESSQ
jgi:hypothetical protein